MRVLVVEDSTMVRRTLVTRLREQVPIMQLYEAEHLAEVQPILDSSVIDAAILDLRIPSGDRTGDASLEFGKAADALVRTQYPGALRIFLTASEADEVVEALRNSKAGDLLISGEHFSLVDHIRKGRTEDLDLCVSRIVEHWKRLSELDAIVLTGDDALDLDQRRALALTVRAAGGHSGNILRNSSGKSGAFTALVECLDHDGNTVSDAFCKAAPVPLIDRELEGYRLAQFQLPSTAFATLGRTIEVGVGPGKALVFTKAPSSTTFFNLLLSDEIAAAETVGKLGHILRGWTDKAVRKGFSVQALIDNVLSQSTRTRFASELESVDVEKISNADVQLLECCQHGDLHGENMFVLENQNPLLIDFGLTGTYPGPMDPVSLELSTIFHELSPLYPVISRQDCEAWFDRPYSEAIQSCRSWAAGVGHSETDYALSALLYALWVIKHAADPIKASLIAGAAIEVLHGHKEIADWPG